MRCCTVVTCVASCAAVNMCNVLVLMGHFSVHMAAIITDDRQMCGASVTSCFCLLLQPAHPNYAPTVRGEVMPPRGINLQPRGAPAPVEKGCHTVQLKQREAEPRPASQEDSVPQRRESPNVSHSSSAVQQSTSTQERPLQPQREHFREDPPTATVPTDAQEQKHVETTTQPPQPLSNSKWSDLPGSPANMSGMGGYPPFAFFMVPMLACPSASGSVLPVPMMMPYGSGEGGGMPFGFPGMKAEKVAGDSVSSNNEDEDEMQVVTIPEMKFLTRVPKKQQQKAISLDETQTLKPSHHQQHPQPQQPQPQPQQQLQQEHYQAHVSHVEKHQGKHQPPRTQQPIADEACVEAVHHHNHHQQQQQQAALAHGSLPGTVPASRGMPRGGSLNMLQQYHMVQEEQPWDEGSSSEEEPLTEDDAPIVLDDDDLQESALEYHKLPPFQRRHASLVQDDKSPVPYMHPPQPQPRCMQKQQAELHPEPTSSPAHTTATGTYAITSLPQSIASEQTSMSHSKLPIMMPPAIMQQQGISSGIPARLLQQGPSAAQPSLLTLASAASSIAVEASLQGSPQGPGSTQQQLLDAQR